MGQVLSHDTLQIGGGILVFARETDAAGMCMCEHVCVGIWSVTVFYFKELAHMNVESGKSKIYRPTHWTPREESMFQ